MKKNKILRLGIIGHGFVGKATDWGFDKNVEKFIVDPKYKSTVKDLSDFNPDMVFVCVPTPMGKDGEQDSSILEETLLQLSELCPQTVVIVKSTVVPSTLKKLSARCKNIIYNPEFLREKHAKNDFENSPMIMLGGDRNICEEVSHAYLYHSKCKTKEHIFLELMSASLVKYAINTFLATKVIFFNELYKLFLTLDSTESWKQITDAITTDQRIGASHTDVPGHDGREGFGGACFPKDSSALLDYAQKQEVNLSVLQSAVKKNKLIRKQYKTLDKREKEQNVSYD